MDKKKIGKKIGFYGILVVLAFIRALGTYVFIVPNGFAPGGIAGISSIVYNIVLPRAPEIAETWLNPAVTVLILNIPLLILAFVKLDKEFAFNTLLGVGFFTLFMGLFSLVGFPQFKGQNYESSLMILAAVAGGTVSGLSMGFMIMLNMSVGGTDIIGKAVYVAHPTVGIQWLISMFDSVVVLFSGIIGLLEIKGGESATQILVNIMAPIFYSVITLFATSKVADVINHGFESSVVFNIVTNKAQEVAGGIMQNLNRGATIVKGEGVYTHAERNIVICVVRRRQSTQLKRIIRAIDPAAFMYINNAKEVNGMGFRSGW